MVYKLRTIFKRTRILYSVQESEVVFSCFSLALHYACHHPFCLSIHRYDFATPAQFTTNDVYVPACPKDSAAQILLNVVTGVAGYVAVGMVGIPPATTNAAVAAPPFDLRHADHITGNSLAAVASWSEPPLHSGASGGDGDRQRNNQRVSSISSWAGQKVQLQVEMVDAKLFAIRVSCA